jgi:hypothetical protein
MSVVASLWFQSGSWRDSWRHGCRGLRCCARGSSPRGGDGWVVVRLTGRDGAGHHADQGEQANHGVELVVGGILIWSQLGDFRHRCLATSSHRAAGSAVATTDRHSRLKLTVRDSVRDGGQSSRGSAVRHREGLPGGRKYPPDWSGGSAEFWWRGTAQIGCSGFGEVRTASARCPPQARSRASIT